MAGSAAECSYRMRAGGRCEEIMAWMSRVGVREFIFSNPLFHVLFVAGLAMRKRRQIARCRAIHVHVAGSTTVETRDLCHTQCLVQIRQPVLSHFKLSVETFNDRLLHQPTLELHWRVVFGHNLLQSVFRQHEIGFQLFDGLFDLNRFFPKLAEFGQLLSFLCCCCCCCTLCS